MNQRQSWKWDAEAAFKRIERHADNKPKFVECGRTFGKSDRPYTPPPNVAAWLKAQADKPKPHGRDIESLMRYHESHKRPVGYWEDAPRGMKFVAKPTRGDLEEDCFSNESDAVAACRTGEHVEKMPDGTFAIYPDSTCPKCGNMMVAGHYCSTGGATAPTTIPPADGPWPKCAYASEETNRWHSGEIVAVYEDADDGGTCYFDNGHVQCCSQSYECNISTGGFVPIALANAIPKLEQNGHKDVAAQLRGKAATKPRDDVATGARAWKWKGVQRCPNGCYVDVGGVMYYKESETFWRRSCAQNADRADAARHIELHGPERDAIIAECRKAMGL